MSLRVENLGVALGKREILRNVSFEIQRGELLIVVGPNGAGKTTLLKAVAGLLPFSGRIAWEGRALATDGRGRQPGMLAYLPQGHVAHWPLSARDIVAIGRAPHASSLANLSAADETAISAAMAAADVEPLKSRAVTTLSGGERARVMLARALAVGAPLLLADEPASSLDPAHQLEVMRVLVERAQAGDIVIATSHDLMLAARFASRVLVLNDGAVAAFDVPGAALTAECLRQVFGIEARLFEADGAAFPVPWGLSGK
ncbi:MAG: ABC transporter ATP-binding protein [Alphaproteobacteria bacterium]